jgi:hypothetical protein
MSLISIISKSAKGFKAEMLDIWRNMRKLPPVIKQIVSLLIVLSFLP